MTHFRKRLSAEAVNRFNEKVIEQARRDAPLEDDSPRMTAGNRISTLVPARRKTPERFCWVLNYEDIKIREYVSFPQLRFGVQHDVNIYNQKLIHSALRYQTPDEVHFAAATCRQTIMVNQRSLRRPFNKKLFSWETGALTYYYKVKKLSRMEK